MKPYKLFENRVLIKRGLGPNQFRIIKKDIFEKIELEFPEIAWNFTGRAYGLSSYVANLSYKDFISAFNLLGYISENEVVVLVDDKIKVFNKWWIKSNTLPYWDHRDKSEDKKKRRIFRKDKIDDRKRRHLEGLRRA